jgi:16S rRNA (guanine527-N7)-methyltransferase
LSAPAARAAHLARVELERLLETDAPVLRATLPPGFADAGELFVALLLEANARINLTRIVEPLDVARLHLLDALCALPVLDSLGPSRAVDLGSGGGVPGIVLALARPDVAWTLVDSVRRKADAMRGFVDALGLGNVTVVAERAEILGRDPDHRERYGVVTARACAALPVLAELALPLVRQGGALLGWKGSLSAEELRAGEAAATSLGGGTPEVRATGLAALGDHRFVLVRKTGPTPDRYPRRAGEAARRPLGGKA